MKKFEYKKILLEDGSDEYALNEWGKNGWQVKHIIETSNTKYIVCYLERPVKEKQQLLNG